MPDRRNDFSPITIGPLLLVNGDDGSRDGPIAAPCTGELPAGSHVRLSLSVEAIDSGYLDRLDPSWVDDVFLVGGGMLTAAHLGELARLSSIRLLSSPFASVETDDLLMLKGRARLRTLQPGPTPVPLPDGLFPHVTDGVAWLAPGFRHARLAAGLPERPAGQVSGSPVKVSGSLTRREDGRLELTIWLVISTGWYTYPPGSAEGLPVSMTLTSPHEVVQPLTAQSDQAHLQGQTELVAVLDGPDEVRLEVTVQACDGSVCHAPTTTRLVVPLRTKH